VNGVERAVQQGAQPTLRPSRLDRVWWLSAFTTIGLFIVNSAGFLDTATGSALGCGREWPLCNGSVIPTAWSLQTAVEFGHRALVALVSALLVTTSVLAWRKYGHWRAVKVFIGMAIGFVVLEAILGAVGVLVGDPPAVLAVHLGVSLMAFTGSTLLTVVLRQIQLASAQGSMRRIQTAEPARGVSGLFLRSRIVPKHFRFWTYFTVFYTIAAMYIGAYIANIGAGPWFQGFPLPTETYAEAGSNLYFDILHRSIALGLILLCLRLLLGSFRVRRERPDLFKGSAAAMVLVLLQGLSGGLLVYSHVATYAFMIHVSIVSCLIVTLCYLALQVLPKPTHSKAGAVGSAHGGVRSGLYAR
jgi:cytochrome c oxidase assembly protein subunit 15